MYNIVDLQSVQLHNDDVEALKDDFLYVLDGMPNPPSEEEQETIKREIIEVLIDFFYKI